MNPINLAPGGGMDGLPPSFYPDPPAGDTYQLDTNGNVITDISGNAMIMSTAVTTTTGSGASTAQNIASAKANLPVPNIIPGIDNTILFVGLGLTGLTILYFVFKGKK
jgi:hypothetical protein